MRGPPSTSVQRERLPITVDILRGLLSAWSNPSGVEHTHTFAMLRAAATTCFFGFFYSGENMVPSVAASNERIHLAWGDVAAEEAHPHQ